MKITIDGDFELRLDSDGVPTLTTHTAMVPSSEWQIEALPFTNEDIEPDQVLLVHRDITITFDRAELMAALKAFS